MLSLRTLLVAAGVTFALSACSFDQLLGKGGSEAVPSAASGTAGTVTSGAAAGTTATRKKAGNAAVSAVGAEVVANRGEYLLCRTTDEYKGRTTSYYTCRERRCIGQEKPATDAKAPKTKSGCLSACRKVETKGARDDAARSYCAS